MADRGKPPRRKKESRDAPARGGRTGRGARETRETREQAQAPVGEPVYELATPAPAVPAPAAPAPAAPAPAAPAAGGTDYRTHVDAFNHDLRVLVRDLAARHPGDATIYRAQRRVMTVTELDPMFVIRDVGPYLYTYRAQIYAMETDPAGIEAFFMENSFDAELRQSVNQDKADLVRYIIPKAKACAAGLSLDEKGQYRDIVVRLLDNYLDFVALTPL
jgi:hypothetical protein